MMKVLDQTKTLYAKEKADELAAGMTAIEADDAGGWTYKANHDPTGKSKWAFIEIFDEGGELVGTL